MGEEDWEGKDNSKGLGWNERKTSKKNKKKEWARKKKYMEKSTSRQNVYGYREKTIHRQNISTRKQ